MKRLIDKYLLEWKDSNLRMPLLIRGARQVGKTYAAQQLGKYFEGFVEVNFERDPKFSVVFDTDLRPDRIIRDLGLLMGKTIIPGKTLLFFDEIQESENVLKSLRYFYELMPNQHVLAAGSLLDFQIEKIGIPVGRVDSLYLYPLSFIEFLYALNREMFVEEILNHNLRQPISEAIHDMGLRLVGEYLAVGGMPKVVKCWRDTQNLIECSRLLNGISDTYKQDFNKYAKETQIKYLELLYDYIPRRLGKKFKYSEVGKDYKKRELEPSLRLLITAGIVSKIFKSAGQGIPLGAQVNDYDFKAIFLDVGLSQANLGLNLGGWLIDPLNQFINKGELVEAFVGQELLAYASPFKKSSLYYWHRDARGSSAEIDYLLQIKEHVVPVEVKSGTGSALQSMHLFLESHKDSPYGIRFSPHQYAITDKIGTYPLYAIAHIAQSVDAGSILKG